METDSARAGAATEMVDTEAAKSALSEFIILLATDTVEETGMVAVMDTVAVMGTAAVADMEEADMVSALHRIGLFESSIRRNG